MREMIDARTAGPNVGGTDDLLSRLFSAREAEKDSPYHFSDAKLTGESILGSSVHLLISLYPLARQWCGLYFLSGHILSTLQCLHLPMPVMRRPRARSVSLLVYLRSIRISRRLSARVSSRWYLMGNSQYDIMIH